MSVPTRKESLIKGLIDLVERDLGALTESQKQTQSGATHEESRAESDKDTRATETSYLARGLARRVEDLRACRAQLSSLALRDYGDDDPIGLAALVTVEDEVGRRAHYFIVPSGGGRKVCIDGETVTTLTPHSPLGSSLAGRRVDDDVEVRRPEGRVALVITDIA